MHFETCQLTPIEARAAGLNLSFLQQSTATKNPAIIFFDRIITIPPISLDVASATIDDLDSAVPHTTRIIAVSTLSHATTVLAASATSVSANASTSFGISQRTTTQYQKSRVLPTIAVKSATVESVSAIYSTTHSVLSLSSTPDIALPTATSRSFLSDHDLTSSTDDQISRQIDPSATALISTRPARSHNIIIIIGAVSGAIGLAIFCGILALYLCRKSANPALRDDHSISSSDSRSTLEKTIVTSHRRQEDAIYGGSSQKVSKSGKIFEIQRLFNQDRDSHAFARTLDHASKQKIQRKLVSDLRIDISKVQGSIPSSMQHVNKSFPHPDSVATPERLHPPSAAYTESSVYSTDYEVPFRLGSPFRNSPDAPLPSRNLESYHLPSWRARGIDGSVSGRHQSVYPHIELNYDENRKSHAVQHGYLNAHSRFSGFTTSSPVPSSVILNATFQETDTLPVMVEFGSSWNYSRPVISSSRSPRVDINDSTTIDMSRAFPESVADGSKLASESSCFEGDDGRRTQVYKLLKRALRR